MTRKISIILGAVLSIFFSISLSFARPFTSHGDGTLSDMATGLVWPQDGSTPTVGSCTGALKTWADASTYVTCLNTSNYLGHNHWRLPSIEELGGLVAGATGHYSDWLNGQGFSSVLGWFYWSSTTDAGNSANA